MQYVITIHVETTFEQIPELKASLDSFSEYVESIAKITDVHIEPVQNPMIDTDEMMELP